MGRRAGLLRIEQSPVSLCADRWGCFDPGSAGLQPALERLASSAPKMFVGEEAKAWASQPLKSWLEAR